MTPQTFYAPLKAIRGVWRCASCIQVLWMTGQPVEGCSCEGCGTTAGRGETQ